VFGVGPAGTGKTMIAVQVAIQMFKEKQVNKIVVTRPVVSVDEDIGFLPGSLEEKMAPWTIPIFDVFKLYFTKADIQNMLFEGVIEISPLAFMRGRTFHSCYIVADEMQNATASQMKMLLTRIGSRSKLAVTGDLAQTDRPKDNGLSDFIDRLNQKSSSLIDIVNFIKSDVQRHEAVKEVLSIYGD
jgi:phosphate starvation-inducible PhoH-like protein